MSPVGGHSTHLLLNEQNLIQRLPRLPSNGHGVSLLAAKPGFTEVDLVGLLPLGPGLEPALLQHPEDVARRAHDAGDRDP